MSCAPGETSNNSNPDPLIRPSSVQNVTRMDVDELENGVHNHTFVDNSPSKDPSPEKEQTLTSSKRSPGVGAESPKKRQSEPITPNSIKRQLSASVSK